MPCHPLAHLFHPFIQLIYSSTAQNHCILCHPSSTTAWFLWCFRFRQYADCAHVSKHTWGTPPVPCCCKSSPGEKNLWCDVMHMVASEHKQCLPFKKVHFPSFSRFREFAISSVFVSGRDHLAEEANSIFSVVSSRVSLSTHPH